MPNLHCKHPEEPNDTIFSPTAGAVEDTNSSSTCFDNVSATVLRDMVPSEVLDRSLPQQSTTIRFAENWLPSGLFCSTLPFDSTQHHKSDQSVLHCVDLPSLLKKKNGPLLPFSQRSPSWHCDASQSVLLCLPTMTLTSELCVVGLLSTVRNDFHG